MGLLFCIAIMLISGSCFLLYYNFNLTDYKTGWLYFLCIWLLQVFIGLGLILLIASFIGQLLS